MKKTLEFVSLAIIVACVAYSSAAQNYKIKQSTSVMGQSISSTVYVKGSRKRTEQGGIMGMGGNVASIEQCDLRRTLQVNDKKRLYTIEPFPTETTQANPTPSGKPVKPVAGQVTKGGTLTMTTSISDTGERKQMFGLTARHIKTSMSMQPSPDACSQASMNMETDGWYVDLPQFSCPMTIPRNSMAGGQQSPSGCQDKIVMKNSGGGRLGFPLQLTQTMNNGGTRFSTSLETIEFSKAILEDTLFDIPAGYSLASSSSDLYGKPDYSAMEREMRNNNGANSVSNSIKNSTVAAKRPGVKRVGVLLPTNPAGENVSLVNLQSYLVQKLTVGNVDAVAVGSEADARAAGCDFLLKSDFAKLNQSTASKIGGIFGKVINADPSGAKNYDAQVNFNLTSLSSGRSVLQSKASSKTDNNVDRAAQGVLAQEAAAVLNATR